MTIYDWTVIGVYFVGMLAIGAYYARNTTSTEDYLLGGRHVNPFLAGLSIFASLVSTITYLAVPGEVLKHGPIAFSEVLGYPVVFLITGWLLIPRIIQQHVSTAYELLETRLGLSIRLLGAALFLVARLLWMGFILYATSGEVIVPMLAAPQSMTPWICFGLGMLTVIYTSMGGLRAVLLTDAVQAAILFGGAILTLIIVTSDLGGVDAWLPREWPEHWEDPVVGLRTDVRMSLLPAMLNGMLWWICMAGSDQIAIQRYLATRDLNAARRAQGISLVATAVSIGLLALVGIAILKYFQLFPNQMAPGTNFENDADRLFQRFIMIGLPPCVTGLVFAALMSAAMSSLSSGINSSCSVISRDFIERFQPRSAESADHIRRTKLISWLVGTLAVLLSVGAGVTHGNLLEASAKFANVLVAPLFILFFMALFVRSANATSTWIAAVSSMIASIGVAYFEWWGMSFVWILPTSMTVGIAVGLIASFLGRQHTAHRLASKD